MSVGPVWYGWEHFKFEQGVWCTWFRFKISNLKQKTERSKACLWGILGVGALRQTWKSRLKYAGTGMALSRLQSGLPKNGEDVLVREMNVAGDLET